jgi:hypothetical protein
MEIDNEGVQELRFTDVDKDKKTSGFVTANRPQPSPGAFFFPDRKVFDPPAPPPPLLVCAHCKKACAVPMRCAKCRSITYCERSCQVSNWPDHKKQCSKLAKPVASAAPLPTDAFANDFSEDSMTPLQASHMKSLIKQCFNDGNKLGEKNPVFFFMDRTSAIYKSFKQIPDLVINGYDILEVAKNLSPDEFKRTTNMVSFVMSHERFNSLFGMMPVAADFNRILNCAGDAWLYADFGLGESSTMRAGVTQKMKI